MYERMRALIFALALGAVCLGSAGSAWAQDEDEEEEEDFYARPGFYLLAQFTNNITLGDVSSGGASNDAGEYSTGAGGAFGYRINTHLAAEVAGDWISGWNAKVAGDGENLVGGTYGVNVKGYLKGGRFQPYGLAGIGASFFQVRNAGAIQLSDAQWDLGIRLALGFDWYLTENLGLNFAPTFVIPVGANGDVGTDFSYASIAVGAFLRFGGD